MSATIARTTRYVVVLFPAGGALQKAFGTPVGWERGPASPLPSLSLLSALVGAGLNGPAP
jgi:hypothetical protein